MRLLDGRECLTCDYCGSEYLPEKNEDGVRVLDDAAEFSCPVCAVPLVHAVLEAHQILYCTRCRGSLIPAPVFVPMLRDLRAHRGDAPATPHPPDPKELQRRIQCPQCHRAMDTHYYAGPGNIVIDDCASCDLNWLYAGELMTIARAPDHACDPESGSIWESARDFEAREMLEYTHREEHA
jgi:Zn-finger nucleic acid-binding protein